MKKFITVILTVCLLIMSLTACDDTVEEYNNETIAQGVSDIYSDLMLSLFPEYNEDEPDILPEDSVLPAFRQYIHKWAADNNIKASHDSHYNIIMSKSAAKGYEDSDSMIIHCELSTKNLVNDLYAAAAAMYIIDNADEHGFFRVIITANDSGTHEGALSINNKYLKGNHLISLKASDSHKICLSSGGFTEYEMSSSLKYNEPTYELAYEISITGLDSVDAGVLKGKHPNPIKTLGNLLANYKSSGILFELASFTGGTDAYTYPDSASVTVLINANNQSAFIKKFENSSSKFLSKYEDYFPELSYTLTEVGLPGAVLSFEDSDYIVSLVYTLINGTYLQNDDGDIVAASNLGVISTNYNGAFHAGITARSISSETLAEMSDIFEVTCHLCNGDYKVVTSEQPWSVSADTPANTSLALQFNNITGKEIKTYTTMEAGSGAVFASRKPELDIASVDFDIDKPYIIVETLLNILANPNMIEDTDIKAE